MGYIKFRCLNSFISLLPAHSVVVLRVAEAGGFQLAAHHCTGALISCQVALQSSLAIHTRPWETTEETRKTKRKDIHCEFSSLLKSGFYLFFLWITNIPHCSTFFDYIAIFSLFGCWECAKSWWHHKTAFFVSSVMCSFLPCCSMPSLCRGRSLLKETTDSVSVWSSKVSTLPVALGL